MAKFMGVHWKTSPALGFFFVLFGVVTAPMIRGGGQPQHASAGIKKMSCFVLSSTHVGDGGNKDWYIMCILKK